jgi:uncharacterized protein related to proFAR isomerase
MTRLELVAEIRRQGVRQHYAADLMALYRSGRWGEHVRLKYGRDALVDAQGLQADAYRRMVAARARLDDVSSAKAAG